MSSIEGMMTGTKNPNDLTAEERRQLRTWAKHPQADRWIFEQVIKAIDKTINALPRRENLNDFWQREEGQFLTELAWVTCPPDDRLTAGKAIEYAYGPMNPGQILPVRTNESLRQAIFIHFGGKCAYCGETLDNSGQWECDHIVPQTQGGPTEFDNLAAACRSCNRNKNNQTPDEWGRPVIRWIGEEREEYQGWTKYLNTKTFKKSPYWNEWNKKYMRLTRALKSKRIHEFRIPESELTRRKNSSKTYGRWYYRPELDSLKGIK